VEAVIVGSSMTAFGMFTPTRLRELATEAAAGALASSGLAAEEIGLVVFGNAAAGILTGQEMIRSQVLLGGSPLAGRPMVNVENACASSSTAFHLACLAVASGTYDAVLAVGAEKMTSEDRWLAARALASALDVEESPYALSSGRQGEAVRPVFMEIYAAAARRYMEFSGATAGDLAAVAAKATRNGALNPIAQVRDPLTVEEVLAARPIVDPLTRPMCSSIGDGAAAVVVCSPELARHRRREAVHVLASVVGSAAPDGPDDLVERTAAAAYEQAGLGPDDVDVMEVHDAAASAELIIYEEVGLAGPGQGVALLRSGVTDLGGRCPVNPSGGLLARGHPIGATGIAQLVELDTQLRGHAGTRQVEGAQLALAQNAGGEIGPGPAVCAVTILTAA
jgi:acetyl-CoA acetyltransferase